MPSRLRNFILFLIISYPFYYFVPQVGDVLSHFFEIVYFFFIDVLILFYLSFFITRFRVAGLAFFICFCVWLTQFSSISDIRPYFFILTLFLLSVYSVQENGEFNYGILRRYPIIFIFLSFISLFLPWSYIDAGARFKGFSLSPTHYSVYGLCAMIFSLYFLRNTVLKWFCVIAITYFIFRSETRLALAVLLMIFSFAFFDKITLRLKSIIASLIIILFSLSYIVYSLITKYTDVFSLRYSGGDDKSYEARTIIQGHVLDDWQNSTLFQYVFGHGAESARNMLIDIYGFDIMPHNDFLKLLYDFGLIGFIVFIFAVFKCGRLNLITLSLLAVYISAFYHNMAYSIFAIAIMVVLRKVRTSP